MKRSMFLIATVCMFAFSYGTAYAKWVVFDAGDVATSSINTDGIKKMEGSVVLVWYRAVFKHPDNIRILKSLREVHCENGYYIDKSTTVTNIDGDESESEEDGKRNFPNPGSVAEAFFNLVCR